MARSAERLRKATIAEFDEIAEKATEARDYELIDGEIVMMTNPAETHEQIASNIGARLKLAMDSRGCRTYQGGMHVQGDDNSKTFNKFKPDVVVRCGPPGTGAYITDPVVVVEVLSPSTMDNYRGPKLRFYKALPRVQHILPVYSDQMRAEHYWRMEEGWRFEALTAGTDVRARSGRFQDGAGPGLFRSRFSRRLDERRTGRRSMFSLIGPKYSSPRQEPGEATNVRLLTFVYYRLF
jgi:Uma2 family endonuclease